MQLDYFGGILLGSLHAMVPITLTASGEVIGESAGLFNIGLEGIILVSAMTAALGAEAGGPAVGLLVGLASGFVIGLIFGGLCTYLKGVQLVAATQKLNRLACDGTYRQRRTAARITIGLGEDNACQR